MKLALFKVGKKAIFCQFFENLLNGIDVKLVQDFDVDKDVIQINNNKNIKLLGQDFINITLKVGQNVGKSKRYYGI